MLNVQDFKWMWIKQHDAKRKSIQQFSKNICSNRRLMWVWGKIFFEEKRGSWKRHVVDKGGRGEDRRWTKLTYASVLRQQNVMACRLLSVVVEWSVISSLHEDFMMGFSSKLTTFLAVLCYYMCLHCWLLIVDSPQLVHFLPEDLLPWKI